MKSFETTAEMFIVPNKGWTIASERAYEIEKGWTSNPLLKKQESRMKQICEMNGVEYKDAGVIQVWVTGPASENFNDHGVTLVGEGDKEVYGAPKCGLIPLEILRGHKEGDVIILSVPMMILNGEQHEDAVLKIHACLRQQKYRYQQFGRFEDVLNQVRP